MRGSSSLTPAAPRGLSGRGASGMIERLTFSASVEVRAEPAAVFALVSDRRGKAREVMGLAIKVHVEARVARGEDRA